MKNNRFFCPGWDILLFAILIFIILIATILLLKPPDSHPEPPHQTQIQICLINTTPFFTPACDIDGMEPL